MVQWFPPFKTLVHQTTFQERLYNKRRQYCYLVVKLQQRENITLHLYDKMITEC